MVHLLFVNSGTKSLWFEYKLQFAWLPDMDKCMYKMFESPLEYSSYSSWQTCFTNLQTFLEELKVVINFPVEWVWSSWEAICQCKHCPRNGRRAAAGDGWASPSQASFHPWSSLYFTSPEFRELVSSLTQTHPGTSSVSSSDVPVTTLKMSPQRPHVLERKEMCFISCPMLSQRGCSVYLCTNSVPTCR